MWLPIIGKFTWRAVGFGAVTAGVTAVALRPIIVGAVRAGYQATHFAKDAWNQAKAEAELIKKDALAIEKDVVTIRKDIAKV